MVLPAGSVFGGVRAHCSDRNTTEPPSENPFLKSTSKNMKKYNSRDAAFFIEGRIFIFVKTKTKQFEHDWWGRLFRIRLSSTLPRAVLRTTTRGVCFAVHQRTKKCSSASLEKQGKIECSHIRDQCAGPHLDQHSGRGGQRPQQAPAATKIRVASWITLLFFFVCVCVLFFFTQCRHQKMHALQVS